MPKGRLEAFSDGVIAVAITVLALELPIPEPHGGRSLAHELAVRWPSFAAFVVSFLTIGVIWINHHAMLARLAQVDHRTLLLNLLLLSRPRPPTSSPPRPRGPRRSSRRVAITVGPVAGPLGG